MDHYCNDCKFYLPVDVFRGICKLSKADILPEDPFCNRAEKIAKCKFCRQYLSEKEFLGKCAGRLAYPDMVATTCTEFKWVSPN
jgi:hypothetical protein